MAEHYLPSDYIVLGVNLREWWKREDSIDPETGLSGNTQEKILQNLVKTLRDSARFYRILRESVSRLFLAFFYF